MNMDIVSVNYQGIWDRAKEDLKKIENKGVSRAETLEDIRETKGKSFRTSDLEKLMEKYDPKAYAEYSEFSKSSNGVRTQGNLAYLSNWMDKIKKGLKDGTISSDGTTGAASTTESKLSSEAQDYLKKLRRQYGNYDFFVGEGSDDLKALAKSGTKEFSVIFSSAELERMANDEKYAKEKLQCLETAVKMSKEINKKYGYESGYGKDGVSITKIGVVFNEDGTTNFFAEMEKSSAKSREHLEKVREEKRARKKEDEKRAERKAEKEFESYSKSNAGTKRTDVQANSMEELIKKIKSVDWNTVKAEKTSENGRKFDFSV